MNKLFIRIQVLEAFPRGTESVRDGECPLMARLVDESVIPMGDGSVGKVQFWSPAVGRTTRLAVWSSRELRDFYFNWKEDTK